MNLLKTIVLICGAAYLPLAAAKDIAREVRAPGEGILNENGGYFEIGLAAMVGNRAVEQTDPEDNDKSFSGAGFTLSGEYRFNGLFIEASEGSFDGINLGYSFWNNDNWQVDFLAASVVGGIRDDDDIEDTDTEVERNDKILKRDTFYSGVGFRVTGYLGNNIVQYRLVTDTYDNNGIQSSLRLGRHWQYRNWNIHGIVGANYRSAKVNQYYWGVSEDEATERFEAYKPGESITLQAELGVTYPVSENWVFRAAARHLQFSDEISDSPLLRDDYASTVFTTITYVF